MLIDFTVKNYKSIKSGATLSLLAETKIKDFTESLINLETEKFSLLPFVGIYGPNASGKSNFLYAYKNFCEFVEYSFVLKSEDFIPIYEPFALNASSIGEPIEFDVEFIADSQRYQYIILFDHVEILSEILYIYSENNRKSILFERKKGKKIKFGKLLKGEKKHIEKTLYKNVLFLSRAVNLANEQLKPIYNFFSQNCEFYLHMNAREKPIYQTSIDLFNDKNGKLKEKIIAILKAADLGVEDIVVKSRDSSNLPFNIEIDSRAPQALKDKIMRDFSLQTFLKHPIYSDNKEIVGYKEFDIEEHESSGTLKLYDIASIILRTLESGRVLFMDELTSGLHSFISQFIVELFQNPSINKKSAQLIVVTHDTSIMEIENIRRDQIWFTDKNKFGETEFYSLSEFNKNQIRKGVSFSNWYLNGRFKAVPTIKNSFVSNFFHA